MLATRANHDGAARSSPEQAWPAAPAARRSAQVFASEGALLLGSRPLAAARAFDPAAGKHACRLTPRTACQHPSRTGKHVLLGKP